MPLILAVPPISIHAPLRERPLLLSPCQSIHRISIHAPSRERLVDKIFLSEILAFQSTLPCGSDTQDSLDFAGSTYFNPRSLAGATEKGLYEPRTKRFQSTLPCGSDNTSGQNLHGNHISIHAPLRERLVILVACLPSHGISIHAPLRERLPGRRLMLTNSGYFNPRSLAGAT